MFLSDINDNVTVFSPIIPRKISWIVIRYIYKINLAISITFIILGNTYETRMFAVFVGMHGDMVSNTFNLNDCHHVLHRKMHIVNIN